VGEWETGRLGKWENGKIFPLSLEPQHPSVESVKLTPRAPFSISFLWAGRMPTPQENAVVVEQASCLFLRMVFFTRKCSCCGTGILPVLENGALGVS